jgi:hypothetical protein
VPSTLCSPPRGPRDYAMRCRVVAPSGPGRTRKANPVVVIGVDRRSVGGDNSGWWPFPRASRSTDVGGHPSHFPGRLTSTSPAIIIIVAKVSFGLGPPAATPKELLTATQT